MYACMYVLLGGYVCMLWVYVMYCAYVMLCMNAMLGMYVVYVWTYVCVLCMYVILLYVCVYIDIRGIGIKPRNRVKSKTTAGRWGGAFEILGVWQIIECYNSRMTLNDNTMALTVLRNVSFQHVIVIIISIIFVHHQITGRQLGGAPTVRSDRVGQCTALWGLWRRRSLGCSRPQQNLPWGAPLASYSHHLHHHHYHHQHHRYWW